MPRGLAKRPTRMARQRPETGHPATNGRGKGKAPRPAPITWETARCEATRTGWCVVLPTPERTNAIWRQWRGRTLVSAKHRQDKQLAPRRFGPRVPLAGDVRVALGWVRARRTGDIDSRLKATLDLLTLVGLWGDDAQVAELRLVRLDDATHAPGLYVWLAPMAPLTAHDMLPRLAHWAEDGDR